MRFFQLCIFVLLVGLSSCSKDEGTVTVNYQEATAIYGDLASIRSIPLNSAVQALDNPGKIFVGANFLLIGEEEQGIHVINNADPENPVFTNFISIPGNREFFVKDNFLYAESYYDLLKINIADPSNVQLVSRAEFVLHDALINDEGETLLGFSFEEVSQKVDAESDLYSEIMLDGKAFIDFAGNVIPKSAVPSSFAGNSNAQSGTVNRISVAHETVYMISNRKMAILSDLGGTLEKTAIKTDELPSDMETIFPFENQLYVGSRSAMTIYNIDNPTDPKQSYQFDHATSCDPVLPAEDVAYITLRTADFSECPGNVNALLVLNLQNQNNPEVAKEINMGSPFGMTIIENYLFVGEGENGLRIFDISNKYNPQEINRNTNVTAYDIIAHPSNSNLLLVAGPDGIDQYFLNQNFDISLQSRIAY